MGSKHGGPEFSRIGGGSSGGSHRPKRSLNIGDVPTDVKSNLEHRLEARVDDLEPHGRDFSALVQTS